MNVKERGNRGRAMWTLAAATAVLAVASGAAADVTASRNCRKTVAKALQKLAKTGFKDADACHKAASQACDPSGSCNDVTNPAFDPKGKYASGKTDATAKIDADCPSGEPVLTNYVGGSVEGAVYPLLDDAIGGNSVLVLGSADLDCDTAKDKCLKLIAKARSGIMKGILKNSTECQKDKDDAAMTFGSIDPSCIDAGADAVAKATDTINGACTGLAGGDVGSCDPLPACVTDAAKTVAQQLAQNIYSVPPPPVCGNGVREGTEQCDDGNTMDGDGCNHLCESELGTCAPPASPNAHRKVTVSITTPQPLAGARLDLAYPIFQSSIPGFGGSSEVLSRVTILQPGGLSVVNDTDTTFLTVSLAAASEFMNTGDLFQVDFDNCVSLDQKICNRTKNVTGCCNNTADPNQFGSCPAGTANAGTVCVQDADCTPFDPVNCTGAGTPNACCTGVGTGPTCIPGNASACTGAGTPFACCTGVGTGPNCTPQCPVKCYSNPPVCAPGSFPVPDSTPPALVPSEVGPCTTPAGGCPGDNVCVLQADATACSVSDPVDHNGNHVDNVTCAVAIVEMP
jgi:cysteine-rich repeat protein